MIGMPSIAVVYVGMMDLLSQGPRFLLLIMIGSVLIVILPVTLVMFVAWRLLVSVTND